MGEVGVGGGKGAGGGGAVGEQGGRWWGVEGGVPGRGEASREPKSALAR